MVAAAVFMLGVQPILLGELVEFKRVTLAGVGLVAMAEIIAIGWGVLLGGALRAGILGATAKAVQAIELAAWWAGGVKAAAHPRAWCGTG